MGNILPLPGCSAYQRALHLPLLTHTMAMRSSSRQSRLGFRTQSEKVLGSCKAVNKAAGIRWFIQTEWTSRSCMCYAKEYITFSSTRTSPYSTLVSDSARTDA